MAWRRRFGFLRGYSSRCCAPNHLGREATGSIRRSYPSAVGEKLPSPATAAPPSRGIGRTGSWEIYWPVSIYIPRTLRVGVRHRVVSVTGKTIQPTRGGTVATQSTDDHRGHLTWSPRSWVNQPVGASPGPVVVDNQPDCRYYYPPSHNPRLPTRPSDADISMSR